MKRLKYISAIMLFSCSILFSYSDIAYGFFRSSCNTCAGPIDDSSCDPVTIGYDCIMIGGGRCVDGIPCGPGESD